MNRDMDAATATEQMFALYKGDVYRYARFTLGNPSAAEDIVQDVFLRVLRNWDRYRGDASPKTWLWSIVRSCIVDYARRVKRDRDRDRGRDRFTIGDYGTYQDHHEVLEAEEMLRSLSPDQREVVVLRLLQDWSTTDAARILGWSESKVKTTLHRAVAKLRQEEGELFEV